MEKQSTTIIVVTHKDFDAPIDPVYLPVCVGSGISNLKNKFQADDTGDNISSHNDCYCELTALYWAWKNLETDIFGLVHYRRYFTAHKKAKSIREILTETEVKDYLNEADAIVTKKKHYFQTVKSHYINCIKSRKESNRIQLELLRATIQDMCPSYIDAYDSVMNGHDAHMLNMFIMKKEMADNYCEWLFPILFELEKRIDEAGVMYDRIMGAFSEFLLDTWLITNNKKYKETYIFETEYNLPRKVAWALKRKLVE